jgi:uncharacterized protein (DUF362 family)
VGGAAFLLHDRRPAAAIGADAPRRRDLRTPEAPRDGELLFARSPNGPAGGPELIRKLLDAFGGMGRFVRRGERVVIKPNVGWDRNEQQAANTNPALIAALVHLCREAGAAEVIVTDVSCNDARRSFTRSGVGLAAQQAGAQVILPLEQDFVTVPMGGLLLQRWPVLKPLLEADRVISVPIVKHHNLTGMTGALKNLYGIIGGRRNLLHQQIDQSLLDLGHFLRPSLVVVDALRVLLRNGPQGGSFQDVQEVGQVAVTVDPVAADAWAAPFLGLKAKDLNFLRLAHGVLGSHELLQVREVG